jgi:hypothetical protein
MSCAPAGRRHCQAERSKPAALDHAAVLSLAPSKARALNFSRAIRKSLADWSAPRASRLPCLICTTVTTIMQCHAVDVIDYDIASLDCVRWDGYVGEHASFRRRDGAPQLARANEFSPLVIEGSERCAKGPHSTSRTPRPTPRRGARRSNDILLAPKATWGLEGWRIARVMRLG